MRLEDEIHQQKFSSEWHKATVNLLFTHGWIVTKIKAFLHQYDISLPQFNVLRILKGSHPKPLTTSIIAERMLDRASDASRIVDRMYKKGWVAKSSCKSDKRLVDVQLTAEGLKLIQSINQYSEQMDEILGKLTLEDVQQLNAILDKIRS